MYIKICIQQIQIKPQMNMNKTAYSSRIYLKIATLLASLFFVSGLQAQTPGLIYEPATGSGISVLDPNGDGYVSKTASGFSTDDQLESELSYNSLSFPSTEPTSDLGPGPDCGFTDFVDQGDKDPVQAFLDANGNWLFRMRMGKTAPNAKSYSVLIDTDGKFGGTGPNKDPEYSTANPGFEIEIVLATKFGVYVYDVNNMNCTPVISYENPLDSHYQKSVAMTTLCGDPDYFYDFYVKMSDLSSKFSGFTSNTAVRMTMIDNMAASKSTICNLTSASDVAGIDDAGKSLNTIFSEVIANYNPTAPSAPKTLDRTTCPKINSVGAGANVISGTSAELAGTTINVFKNGISIGTTTVSAGVWSLSGIAPAIALNDVITATATTSGKGTSIDNCNPVTAAAVPSCSGAVTTAPALTDIVKPSSGKGYDVTVNRPIGTIVRCYNTNGTLIDPMALGLQSPNNLNTVTTTALGQKVSFECKQGNCFGSTIFLFTYQEPGKCESTYAFDCGVLTATVNPTITSPVLAADGSISGLMADGGSDVTINLYSAGQIIGTTSTAGTGKWKILFTGRECETLSVKAFAVGKCGSSGSVTAVVQSRKAFAPVVNEICSPSLTSVVVSGTSVEPKDTKINFYVNGSTTAETVTATVSVNGTWSATIASGTINSIKAKASSDCLTLSDFSNTVTIHQQSTNLVTIDTALPLFECGTLVSGTGTNGDTISLYIDGSQIGGTATVVNSKWTISGLNATCDLYAGGVVTATASTGSNCGGNVSNGVTVLCTNPSDALALASASASICSGTAVTVTVVRSEKGIVYQLYNGTTAAATPTGSSKLGTGGDLILTSAPLSISTTLTIRAIRIGTSCFTKLINEFSVTVNNPTTSVLSGTATICNGTAANLSVAITGGKSPYNVTIDNGVGTISNYTSGSAILVSPTTDTTYAITAVTGADGCPSIGLSSTAVITVKPIPAIPTIGNIIQPTCTTATGSFEITNYNSNPSYAYTVSPSTGVTKIGNIITAPAGNYTITATSEGCTSAASVVVAVNTQPVTPAQPTLVVVTQPTCSTAEGSFEITNYQSNYTYTINPSNGVGRSGAIVYASSGNYTVSATLGVCVSTANTIRLDNLVCPNDDSGSVSATGGTAIFNVLSNDKVGGVQATFTNASISESGTWPRSITLNTNTGAVNVASGMTAGTYTVTYQICDKLTPQVCSIATNIVEVKAALNQAPVAVDDHYTVAEGETLNIMKAGGVLKNDTDAENNELKAILVAEPAHGTLTLNQDGSFSYTHDGSETTSDSYTYKVNDGQVNGNTVTVSITVTPVNDAPKAVADSYTVAEGGTLTIPASGVLTNDTDVDSNTLNAIVVAGPTKGNLTLNTDGSFTYTHNGSETTSDFYTYKVNDGTVDGNTVTVSITITPVNDAPVAVDDAYTVAEGGTLTIAAKGILANDSDAEGNTLTAILVTNPINGTLTLNANGSFSYTHNGSETTTDSYTYKVNDGSVDGNTATVTITITPVNDAPVALADNYTVAEGGTLTITAPGVLANDKDAEGNPLKAIVVAGPTKGTLTLNPDGSFTYIHIGSETTTDSYTYKVNDGTVDGNTVTVSITITPVNDAPVAIADSYTVAEGATLTIAAPGVLANDTDAESNPITAILVSNPVNGTLTLNSDGSFTYIHNGTETTSDSYTYKVNDGSVDGNTVTVSITITPVNDAPVAIDDNTNASIASRAGATPINTLKATDVDGTIVSYTVLTLPANGTLVLSGVPVVANQVLTPAQAANLAYDPSGTYTGVDTFTFTATDNKGAIALSPATITINVEKTVINAVADTVNSVVRVSQVVTVVNVLNNDLLSNNPVVASDVNLKEVTPDPKGVLKLNTDGTVELKPNSPAGTYTLTYEICEKANPTNCASATVSVTVIPPVIVAVADNGTPINGYVGGTVLGTVLTNDTLNGNVVNPSDVITTFVSSGNSKITLSGNSVVVAAGTPAGTYTLTYSVCEKLYTDNCATATVSVMVTAPGITATDDISTDINGIDGGKVSNVLSNDTLNGTAINKDEVIISLVSPLQSDISLSGTDVIVAPTTPAGSYSLTYQICEILNPTNCARANVKVTVTVPGIDVQKDAGTVNGLVGGTAVANVLENDIYNGSVIPEDEAKITMVSTTHSNIILSGTAVVVAPGTPAGDYKLIYEVCSIAFPTNCAQAVVSVTVTAPGLDVKNDIGTPVVGEVGGIALTNVLENDTYNDDTITDDLAITSFVSSSDPKISMSGKAVVVAPGTPAGDYSLIYKVCSILNPEICAQATVSVTVTASAIVAANDTVTLNGYTGGTALNNVLANDKLNGIAVTASEVKITTVSSSHSNISLSGGNVVVAQGTPAGTYTLIYNICEILNPNNCAQGTVTITVTAPAIIAVNDTAASINGYVGGTALANVLANDTLNGTAVIASEVKTTFVASTNSNITLSGTDVKVAAGTPAGTYSLTYSICEKLNPNNCSEATVWVTVTGSAIVVRDAAGSINGYVGGTVLTNVLTNVTLNGNPVIPTEVKTTFVSSTNPNITLSGNNVVVAPGTPAGTYTLTYTVCELLNPNNCAEGTVTITVTAPIIAAVNDTAASINGYVGGTAFANVLANDKLNGTAVKALEVNTTFVSSTNPNITLSGTNIMVAAGTQAGTYSLTYSICEKLNPNNCSQATVSVTVTAAVIVVRDSAGSINGYVGGTVTNVLTNATLNGIAVKASEVKTTFVSSTNPNITLSGNNVVVAPGTPAGTYKLTYTVCELLNPTNCAQATITVKVNAPVIAAVNDLGTPINGYVGGTVFANVLSNDTLNGTAVIASEVNLTFVSSTSPNITLSGTNVIVAAGTAAGTYSLTYSICEKLNPNNCSVATVKVIVNAPAIVGVNDTATSILGLNGGIALANVLENDTINGKPVNPSEVKTTLVSSTHPNITLSGTAVVVAPDTPNGIYTLTYSICEKLNPDNCTQATVKITVVSHEISAGDDTVTLSNGNEGRASLINVLANDKLNGSGIYAPEIILKGKEIPSGITLKNDGTISVVAGLAGGTYTLTYEICEAANSSNCSIGTVSIFVEVPSIALLETVTLNDSNGNGFAEAGESLTYNFTVTNTGNTDLENIAVSDSKPGMTITGGPITLAVGATDDYSFVGTYVLTQADVNARSVVTQGTASGTANSGVVAEDKSDPISLMDNNPTVFELNGCIIKVFNAVSPNGDSKNARFYIQGIECYPDNTVSIFNRWGVMVFERDHYNNEDVVFKGFSEGRVTIKNSEKLPEGSYYYVIKYKDGQSSPHQEVGYLYISK
jgi:large repetitive protein